MRFKLTFTFIITAVVLTACNLFPGYFLPWANSHSGIGGGSWVYVGDTSSTFNIHPNFKGMMDMDVADNGNVLVGIIDSGDVFPYVYQYTPAGSWSSLETLPYVNTGELKENISVTYVLSNTVSIPYVSFHNPSSNITWIHDYLPSTSSWRTWSVAYMSNVNRVELIPSSYQNSVDHRLFVMNTTTNDLHLYTNITQSVGSSTYGPPTLTTWDVCHNIEDSAVVVGVGDTTSYDIIQFPINGTPFNLPSFSGGYSTNIFALEVSGTNTSRQIYLAYTTNSQVSLARNNASFWSIITNLPMTGIKDMDSAFDYGRHIMYLAISDSDGFIVVYAYDESNSSLRQLGGQIQGIDARVIRLEHQEGSNELYLAFGDGMSQKFKVMRYVD